MAGLDSVPDSMKWRIAADFSAQMPARYDRAFRSIVGKRYDEIEQEIWMEVAETAITLAKNLSLPVGTAQDLAETMRTVMVILFGVLQVHGLYLKQHSPAQQGLLGTVCPDHVLGRSPVRVQGSRERTSGY
jgi:hypothetical protein